MSLDTSAAKKATRRRWPWFLGAGVVVLSALGVALRLTYSVYQIPTKAMEPTLLGDPATGDRIVVDRTAYRSRPLERWDVIVFRYSLRRDRLFVFRVAGLPGERISIRKGRVYVGEAPALLPEGVPRIEYTNLGVLVGGNAVDVPAGRYLVLGDNSPNARDSRLWTLARLHLADGRTIEGEFSSGGEANPLPLDQGRSLRFRDREGVTRDFEIGEVRSLELVPWWTAATQLLPEAWRPVLGAWEPRLAESDPDVATVAAEDILGKAVRIMWPPERAGRIR